MVRTFRISVVELELTLWVSTVERCPLSRVPLYYKIKMKTVTTRLATVIIAVMMNVLQVRDTVRQYRIDPLKEDWEMAHSITTPI